MWVLVGAHMKGCPKTGVVAFMQLMKRRNHEPWNSPWHVQQFGVGTWSSMMHDFLMSQREEKLYVQKYPQTTTAQRQIKNTHCTCSQISQIPRILRTQKTFKLRTKPVRSTRKQEMATPNNFDQSNSQNHKFDRKTNIFYPSRLRFG